MNEVRLPRLLDANGQEERRLSPTALSLNIEKDGCSTANLTLPGEDEPLGMLRFLELYTLKGSAGLYRVTEDQEAAAGDNTRTYGLRHAIDTLRDSLWREQADFDGTMEEFLTGLLSWQTTEYWQLGDCEDTGDWKKSGINYDHLDELLDEVRADRRDYVFQYDFSTTPWTLHFRQVSQAVDCEMRMTRNLKDGQARSSRTQMCNRLYLSIHTTVKKETVPSIWSGGAHKGEPTGKSTAAADKTTETETELRIYEDAASQAEYGVIEGTADINTEDVPDADEWAARFLQEHGAPIRQATGDVWEVVKTTGEPFDQYDVGKIARMAVPRDGWPVEAPIVSVQYGDLLGEPEKAKVSLNRKAPKFSESLASLRKETKAASARAGGAGRSAAKAEEVTHWAMVVQHILEALEGAGVDQIWETGIVLDAEQGARIYSFYDGLTQQGAQISVNNEQISLLVQKTGVNSLGSGETLLGKINVEAGKISQIVSAVGSNGEVTAASIVAAINGGGSSVKISADHIDIDGWLRANQTTVAGLYSQGGITALDWITTGGYITAAGRVTCGSLTVNGDAAEWKSQYVITSVNYQLSPEYFFVDSNGSSHKGHVVQSFSRGGTTIYYLGK